MRVESPSISMTLNFIDTDQVIGRKGITGGELIELTIKDGDDSGSRLQKNMV